MVVTIFKIFHESSLILQITKFLLLVTVFNNLHLDIYSFMSKIKKKKPKSIN